MPLASLTGLAGMLALAAAGCGTAPAIAVPSTTPTLEVAPATPTEIIWFPPTETAAVATVPPLEPTAEKKPPMGALLFRDAMTSSAYWNAATSPDAGASVSDKGLTISVQPGAPAVVSMHRSAVVDDAYMEVTARPSLCRDRDAYGLVFRAPNDVAHYRFVAICDGTAAAERISLATPHVLQPPTASADVPFGAPGAVRLGVWASGKELRFFLNDRYQFTAMDSNYLAGGIGVFVEPGGDTAVVVTFSDMVVYRLPPGGPDVTPAP